MLRWITRAAWWGAAVAPAGAAEPVPLAPELDWMPIGDVNGDGFGDLVGRDFSSDLGAPNGGYVYIVPGSAEGPAPDGVWSVTGTQERERLGLSVGALGDVNGDGYDDFAAGGDLRALVFMGGPGGPDTNPSLVLPEGALEGAGDLDGDGVDDALLVTTDFDYDHDTVTGELTTVRWFRGGASGLSEAPAITWSSDIDRSARGVGDVNGDGFDDLLLFGQLLLGASAGPNGEPFWTVPYGQLVLRGAGDIDGDGFDDLELFPGAIAHGGPGGLRIVEWEGVVGARPISIGDVNGDGFSDVMSGDMTFSADIIYQGAAYVYAGEEGGLPRVPAWCAYGGVPFAMIGADARAMGDVNGDGFGDFLIMEWLQGEEGLDWLFFGDAVLEEDCDVPTTTTPPSTATTPTDEATTTTDTAAPPSPTEPRDCGCRSAPGPGALLLLVVAGLSRRHALGDGRRRRHHAAKSSTGNALPIRGA